MNGESVGIWRYSRTGLPIFRYEASWARSPSARPLSLSLPITADLEVRGESVSNFFDNLLPDNLDIRRRIRSRFQTPSTEAFDLLTAIGRDCIGAVQLLPEDQLPDGWNRVTAKRLSQAEIEKSLRDVTVSVPLGSEEQDDFRISLAGAQEKTALLRMSGRWFHPADSTPTTHILKLPLGIVGNFREDFSESVENEWLCGRLLAEMGLPVADSEVSQFGEERALVVTRFDRRWQGVTTRDVQRRTFRPSKDMWIARLPQEDMCQALGLPPTRRYQSEGGPSIQNVLEILTGSEQPEKDQTTFLLAQLAFWLLAATDGHGKNFSIFHLRGGGYVLTPLYDVISAWPVIGHGRNELPREKAKLAMAVPGRRPHYRLDEINARHWQDLAKRTGISSLWDSMQALVGTVRTTFDRVGRRLPQGFPEHTFARILEGVMEQAKRFEAK